MTRLLSAAVSFLLLLSACQTLDKELQNRLAAINAAISTEPTGNFYIGRRFYKEDYKMWGWVREPRKPWNTAKLVMLNEQKKLAPDREANAIGSDNNYEYRLYGYFSGDTVYEPASNGFYPEFVLTGYELISKNPPMIFADPRSLDPKIRLLAPPL
ncbi:MAG: hypothetical protein N2035_07525 [Chthoniobacterales bacterium]|nr:hypothetical protein [Chthoniobacterales bacterium]MCX7713494.1 hypothetical protein [Chthoniobacterales bacterium]